MAWPNRPLARRLALPGPALIGLVGLALVGLAGCGDDQPAPPASQKAACELIEAGRSEYRAAEANPNRLAGDARKAEIVDLMRRGLLNTLPGGRIEDWVVRLEKADTYLGGKVIRARFDIGCGAFLVTPPAGVKAYDFPAVKTDDPYARVILALKAGLPTRISAELFPDPKGKYAFHELSLTEAGAFNAPELAIRITRLNGQ